MNLEPGDRVRWETTGDDGFPLVRYGFVGACNGDGPTVSVMLDGELKGDHEVHPDQLETVSITNLELRLDGADLLQEPSLRQGLVSLWSAEADQAGLEVRSLIWFGDGVLNGNDGDVTLAELQSGGRTYLLRARPDVGCDAVRVRAIPSDS